jgi:hypothetical protein
MPSYQVLADPPGGRDIDTALHGVEDRFPEVAIERSGGEWSARYGAVRLACRAPSESHVRRCLAAAGLLVLAIERS